FTSGGTEANTLALTPNITGSDSQSSCDCLFISAVEHPSVRAGGRFDAQAIHEIPVTPAGVVDLAALEAELNRAVGQGRRPLVAIMLANNETGVIQPIAEAVHIVHAAGGLLHVDAVQAPGKIQCDFKALGADVIAISAHKIGGPTGVGALIKRSNIQLAPLVKGGG